MPLYFPFGVFEEREYFGPGTDYVAKRREGVMPVDDIDAAAMRHDRIYHETSNTRVGRSRRARADLDMAREVMSSSFLIGGVMAAQGLFRVMTFNLISLPWD